MPNSGFHGNSQDMPFLLSEKYFALGHIDSLTSPLIEIVVIS